MPRKPKKPCAVPNCPNLTNGRYCEAHAHLDQKVQHEKRRASSSQRGYNYKWQKARRMFLREHPLCIACQRQGRITPATVVDHIQPHRGNQELFWDVSNWQPLCKACHDRKTMSELNATRRNRTP